MKLRTFLIVAGLAVGPLTALAPLPAAAQVSVSIGAPSGPGWYRWREHRKAMGGWDGPVYYDVRGPHFGWYSWNNNYYQNCSWRWNDGRRHRHRDWTCW
jgi:hypothetical protein